MAVTRPWDRRELQTVLDGLSALSHRLTPSPVPAAPAGVPGGRDWWGELAREDSRLERLPGLDPWIRAHTDLLAATSEASGSPFAGHTLLHTDIRADNILFAKDRVVFVDWPHARVGAPWVDLVFFLPSVAMQGGPDPEVLFWRHPSASGADRVSTSRTARTAQIPTGSGDRSRQLAPPDDGLTVRPPPAVLGPRPFGVALTG
jgi:aminoglycoside phosphotransferase (APT) family kinase protein